MQFVDVDFAECIECGSQSVKIGTECPRDGFFYDGDAARCQSCGLLGMVHCDAETPVYISWQDIEEE